MAFARNWPEIVHIYDLHYNDIVKFKIQAFIMKMTIYKAK
jgi:predicted MPP superfamily phosphohydrolase